MPLESDNKSQAVLPKFLPPLVLEQIFNFMNPIGSFYYNKVDPRSPTEIFGIGCGTWVSESGYFPVGKSASGTFATLGSTGGAETVTLTLAQVPAHTHGRNIYFYGTGNGTHLAAANGSIVSGETTSDRDQTQGGGGSHPNLPPYRVVSMWVRIA